MPDETFWFNFLDRMAILNILGFEPRRGHTFNAVEVPWGWRVAV
jgi:hypothetical protein